MVQLVIFANLYVVQLTGHALNHLRAPSLRPVTINDIVVVVVGEVADVVDRGSSFRESPLGV